MSNQNSQVNVIACNKNGVNCKDIGDNYTKSDGSVASSGFDALYDFFKNFVPFSKNMPGWLIYN